MVHRVQSLQRSGTDVFIAVALCSPEQVGLERPIPHSGDHADRREIRPHTGIDQHRANHRLAVIGRDLVDGVAGRVPDLFVRALQEFLQEALVLPAAETGNGIRQLSLHSGVRVAFRLAQHQIERFWPNRADGFHGQGPHLVVGVLQEFLDCFREAAGTEVQHEPERREPLGVQIGAESALEDLLDFVRALEDGGSHAQGLEAKSFVRARHGLLHEEPDPGTRVLLLRKVRERERFDVSRMVIQRSAQSLLVESLHLREGPECGQPHALLLVSPSGLVQRLYDRLVVRPAAERPCRGLPNNRGLIHGQDCQQLVNHTAVFVAGQSQADVASDQRGRLYVLLRLRPAHAQEVVFRCLDVCGLKVYLRRGQNLQGVLQQVRVLEALLIAWNHERGVASIQDCEDMSVKVHGIARPHLDRTGPRSFHDWLQAHGERPGHAAGEVRVPVDNGRGRLVGIVPRVVVVHIGPVADPRSPMYEELRRLRLRVGQVSTHGFRERHSRARES